MSLEVERKQVVEQVFETSRLSFEEKALRIYQYQKKHNPIYNKYISLIGAKEINRLEEIPHMPISAYKHHKVVTGSLPEEIVYTSSGTSIAGASHHYVYDRQRYLDLTVDLYEHMYDTPLSDIAVLALLPSYLERDGSSLIDMIQHFISLGNQELSDFYLYDHSRLYDALLQCKEATVPTLLFGVTYALLDFCDEYRLHYPELTVMETGGMKGTRQEMPKAYVHKKIKSALGVSTVHSEYGMTELSSQLYSRGDGVFDYNRYIKAHIRDITDPLSDITMGKQGIICLTDLANIDSCAFIMTDDTGYMPNSDQLVLTGRVDLSEARGCNLMITDI